MQPWSARTLCPGQGFRPRQFEYHPTVPGVLLFGTLRGEVAVVSDVGDARVHGGSGRVARRWAADAGLSHSRHDSILGLCWLRKSPNRFVCGSSQGVLRMCALGADDLRTPTAVGDGDDGGGGGDGTTRLDEGDTERDGGGVAAGGAAAAGDGGGGGIVGAYDKFDKLTSVHVNCDDRHVLASGYSLNVRLYDIETTRVVREFTRVHPATTARHNRRRFLVVVVVMAPPTSLTRHDSPSRPRPQARAPRPHQHRALRERVAAHLRNLVVRPDRQSLGRARCVAWRRV